MAFREQKDMGKKRYKYAVELRFWLHRARADTTQLTEEPIQKAIETGDMSGLFPHLKLTTKPTFKTKLIQRAVVDIHARFMRESGGTWLNAPIWSPTTTVHEERGPLPRPKKDFNKEHFADLDAADAVGVLSDALARFATPQRIRALETALKAAQFNPPADKRAFAVAVNHLLDVFRVRIKAEDGQLYRLRVQAGRKKGGEYIGLAGGGGTRAKSFRDSNIRLVADPTKPAVLTGPAADK